MQNLKIKTAAHGDMSRRDEEDIEVCLRSIDLWGSFFIDYYIVACQAFFFTFFIFFLFFSYYSKIQQVAWQSRIKWVQDRFISLNKPSGSLNQQKAGHRLSKIESLMGISICGVKRGAQ